MWAVGDARLLHAADRTRRSAGGDAVRRCRPGRGRPSAHQVRAGPAAAGAVCEVVLAGCCRADLGNSIYGSRIPVSQLLIEAAPRTLSLAVLAFVVSVLIAIPAGLVSALRRGQPIDHGW